jgi:hypothetical protein
MVCLLGCQIAHPSDSQIFHRKSSTAEKMLIFKKRKGGLLASLVTPLIECADYFVAGLGVVGAVECGRAGVPAGVPAEGADGTGAATPEEAL